MFQSILSTCISIATGSGSLVFPGISQTVNKSTDLLARFALFWTLFNTQARARFNGNLLVFSYFPLFPTESLSSGFHGRDF